MCQLVVIKTVSNAFFLQKKCLFLQVSSLTATHTSTSLSVDGNVAQSLKAPLEVKIATNCILQLGNIKREGDDVRAEFTVKNKQA